jgi:hypothetical protein
MYGACTTCSVKGARLSTVYSRLLSRGVPRTFCDNIAECDNYAFPVQVTYYLRIRVYVRTVTSICKSSKSET